MFNNHFKKAFRALSAAGVAPEVTYYPAVTTICFDFGGAHYVGSYTTKGKFIGVTASRYGTTQAFKVVIPVSVNPDVEGLLR